MFKNIRKRIDIEGRVRTRAYGGLNPGRLHEFKYGEWKWQVVEMQSGRCDVVVLNVATGLPRLGWIEGDWLALGTNPLVSPELGRHFGQFELPSLEPLKLFHHLKTPVESILPMLRDAAVMDCVARLQLSSEELLVLTPGELVLKARNRSSDDGLLSVLVPLKNMANRFGHAVSF